MEEIQKKSRSEEEEYYLVIATMAPGYRFQPTEVELVLHYLLRKINNQPLPPNLIHVVNFYQYNPETLAERFEAAHGKKEWYFVTPRQRKYPKGSRPDRGAGDGYWKATGSDQPILHNGFKVGNTKPLVFIRGKHSDDNKIKTDWRMTEFVAEKNGPSPLQTNGNNMKLDDWVLCKLHKSTEKQRGTKRKKTADKDDDTDPITEEDELETPKDNTDEAIDAIQDPYHGLPDEPIQLDNHLYWSSSFGACEPFVDEQIRDDQYYSHVNNFLGAQAPPAVTSFILNDYQPETIPSVHSVPFVHSFNDMVSAPAMYPIKEVGEIKFPNVNTDEAINAIQNMYHEFPGERVHYEHNPYLANCFVAYEPLAGEQIRYDHHPAHEPPAATLAPYPQQLDASRLFDVHSFPFIRHQPELRRVHPFNELLSAPPIYADHINLRNYLTDEDLAPHHPFNHTKPRNGDEPNP